MKTIWLNSFAVAVVAVTVGLVVAKNLHPEKSNVLLNVSYDPTRELWAALNEKFLAQYDPGSGPKLVIKQSHGGSSSQSHAVLDGLAADVVTLAMYSDIDVLRKHGLIANGWAKRLPNNSLPYTSTIVFVVRKGNPRGIKDWPDLIRPNVAVITPNPKTSGNGKLTFIAAWGSVIRGGGDEQQARQYVTTLFEHVPFLDTGARGSTTRFATEKVGDVHLTWENEALLEVRGSNGELEIVYPKSSIRAEPYVAWVDTNVRSHGTVATAKAYLEFLYKPEAQEILAAHGYRPIDEAILAKHRDLLPEIELFPITILAKSWDDAQYKFFADDGIFDEIYVPKKNN